jgi:hypothetical protein
LDKAIDQFSLAWGRFLDTELTLFGWKTGGTWGDIVSGLADAANTTMISSSGLMPSTTHSDLNREI